MVIQQFIITLDKRGIRQKKIIFLCRNFLPCMKRSVYFLGKIRKKKKKKKKSIMSSVTRLESGKGYFLSNSPLLRRLPNLNSEMETVNVMLG